MKRAVACCLSLALACTPQAASTTNSKAIADSLVGDAALDSVQAPVDTPATDFDPPQDTFAAPVLKPTPRLVFEHSSPIPIPQLLPGATRKVDASTIAAHGDRAVVFASEVTDTLDPDKPNAFYGLVADFVGGAAEPTWQVWQVPDVADCARVTPEGGVQYIAGSTLISLSKDGKILSTAPLAVPSDYVGGYKMSNGSYGYNCQPNKPLAWGGTCPGDKNCPPEYECVWADAQFYVFSGCAKRGEAFGVATDGSVSLVQLSLPKDDCALPNKGFDYRWTHPPNALAFTVAEGRIWRPFGYVYGGLEGGDPNAWPQVEYHPPQMDLTVELANHLANCVEVQPGFQGPWYDSDLALGFGSIAWLDGTPRLLDIRRRTWRVRGGADGKTLAAAAGPVGDDTRPIAIGCAPVTGGAACAVSRGYHYNLGPDQENDPTFTQYAQLVELPYQASLLRLRVLPGGMP